MWCRTRQVWHFACPQPGRCSVSRLGKMLATQLWFRFDDIVLLFRARFCSHGMIDENKRSELKWKLWGFDFCIGCIEFSTSTKLSHGFPFPKYAGSRWIQIPCPRFGWLARDARNERNPSADQDHPKIASICFGRLSIFLGGLFSLFRHWCLLSSLETQPASFISSHLRSLRTAWKCFG